MNSTLPTRFKLEDVPPVGWYENAKRLEKIQRCPEDSPIPAVIRSIMEYHGEGLGCHKAGLPGFSGAGDLSCGYAFLNGVSGAAFYTCWDEKWQEDCVSIIYLGHDYQTAELRCFNALGYSFEWILPKEGADNKRDWLARIAELLAGRSMPVLSYGIIGPPEPAIITGWDEGGDVLMGWNFFQEYPWNSTGCTSRGDFEADGQFRKRDWLEGNFCLLVIGERKERADLKTLYRDSLEWGLTVFRTPKVFPEADAPEWVAHKWNGQAALKSWQASLLDDASFPAADEALLRHHHQLINNVAGNLAEERSMADVFLQQVAAVVPSAAPDLIAAGQIYQSEHDLVFKMWSICAGLDKPAEATKLADPGVRKDLAAVIAEMQEREERHVLKLEDALKNWN